MVLLLAGLPIGFSLLLSGFVGYGMITNFSTAMAFLGPHTFNSLAKFIFTPIPLFVLMGEILGASGIGGEMFDVALKWFGRLRGGLCVAGIMACALFGAMCGVSIAGAVTIGIVAIPAMIRHGYDKGLAAGSVTCAGTLAIMIPPSLSFIIYGVVAEESIGELFIAGILPGILITLLFSTYVLIRAWRQPSIAPGVHGITWKERIKSLRRLWAAIVLILAVLGSIYSGIATPTEAAGVGAVGALFVSLIYRSMTFRNLIEVAKRTSVTIGFIMILVVGALFFSYYLTLTGVTQDVATWMVSLPVSPWVIIGGMCVILFILGMFLDPTAIILITTPLFLPVINDFGFSPIWYGVILVMTLEIAFVTPPVGMNLYAVSNIVPDIPLEVILKGSIPFLLLIVLAIVILMFFPQIALWLPSLMSH